MAIWRVAIGSPKGSPKGSPNDPRWRLHSEGRIQAEETGAIWEPEAAEFHRGNHGIGYIHMVYMDDTIIYYYDIYIYNI